MNVDKVSLFIRNHVALIAVDAKGLAEARERAGKFLIASAVLLSALKDLELSMTKSKSLSDASFAQAMSQGEGKVTEKKAAAQSDDNYLGAREGHESLEAQRNWIRGFIRIFENAHLMYRAASKGD